MAKPRRIPGHVIVAVGLAVFLLIAILIAWRTAHVLRQVSKEVQAEREIHFSSGPYRALAENKFEPVSAPMVFQQAARFQDRFYVTGPAGLLEYDLEGKPLRQFLAGKELPASPLVAVASTLLADSSEPELVLATAQEGLLAYNGRNFRQIYLQDANARSITSILPVAAGHLLIGTKKRGVLVFDGKQITPLHPTLTRMYVQVLAGTESDLWIGTLDQGVFHWHAGMTESFGEEQGLPDRQVQSIVTTAEKTYVGTVLGVAEFDRGRFSRVLAQGVLATSLAVAHGNLLVGTEDQGVLTVPLQGRSRNGGFGRVSEIPEVRGFFASRDDLFVLTRSALFKMNSTGLGLQQVLQPGTATLSDRNISALAADRDGRLWIGYFDHGLDILQLDSGLATHVENEHVFCVNKILPDLKTGTVAVATANGLVRFAASGSQEQILTRADGLIADHVTDVVAYGDGLALATPAGLTFLDSSGARSMYAFNGLVSNHVYALGVSGDELLAGTLGGLSVIDKNAVRVNYTVGTSGLKHNWITAVAPVGDHWMIGTYGAGISELDAAGRFHSFEKASGPFEINPSAMLVTPRLVLAGSLGHGLYVFDRVRLRWFVMTEGLPSENVTAIAEHGAYLYIGTDNGLVRIEETKLNP